MLGHDASREGAAAFYLMLDLITFFDLWYLDDGQIFCDEENVDAVLKALDARMAAVGASRGSGSGVKSVARVLGDVAVDDPRGWITSYAADTCQTPAEVVSWCMAGRRLVRLAL